MFTHILNFVFLNEDGIDPGPNNTPRPPITGKRTTIFFYFISMFKFWYTILAKY